MFAPLAILALVACETPDVSDSAVPTDTDLPAVGSDVLQFHGRVPKHLIFFSIDTFRRDHIGAYGSTMGLTPFLDRIASESVVMDDHLQCSCWTFASTTCTLAGRSNIERGHIPRLNGNDENRPRVPAGTPFLATWLGEAGYYSVIVSGNDWLSANWGNTQGYDESKRPMSGDALGVYNTASGAIKDARARGEADKWFMHMHFMEPHAAYDPPAEYIIGEEELEPWPEDLTNRDTHYEWRGQYPGMGIEERDLLEAHLRILYQGEIRHLDDELSEVWEKLDAEGFLDDALVVFWNDHGEQFWEHGFQTHAYQLNREENDGFLWFWSKNIVPGRYAGPTSSIDLVPTILDLHDIDQPAEVTGFPVGDAPPDRPRFAEVLARLGGANAVTLAGKKMIYSWNGKVEVYDRNVDPHEENDIFDPTDPEQLHLWSLLKPQAEAMAPLIVNQDPAPVWPPNLP